MAVMARALRRWIARSRACGLLLAVVVGWEAASFFRTAVLSCFELLPTTAPYRGAVDRTSPRCAYE